MAEFEIKSDIDIQIEKENKMLNIIEDITSYYREYPHLFAYDYLKVELRPFQKLLIYEMFHNNFVNINACRGIGKTWLIALYCIEKCILYPGTKICVTSNKLKQAIEVLKKITNEFCINYEWGSDLLNAEIKKIILNGEDPQIIFNNGSYIYAVAANRNARSKRSTVNIYDEFVQMDPEIIRDILVPFLTSKRQPGFINNPLYKDDVEENSQFYLSSAWYKSEWSFQIVKDYITNMLLEKEYFSCCLPYQLSIESGNLSESMIRSVYDDSNFDLIKFLMEYECIWFGSNGTEFFSYDDIKPRRILTKSLPIPELVLNNKAKINEPDINERRILSVDVALMASTKTNNNDAACFIINNATPNDRNIYTANIMLIDTFEGLRTEELGNKVLQYYHKYKCTDILVDGKGNGQGVLDYITKEQVDPITGEIYLAFKAVNNPDWADRCKEDEYIETLYVITATQKFNDDVAVKLRNGFQNNKINLLISEYDCYNRLLEDIPDFDKKDDESQLKYQKPFYETTFLVNELINLESEIKGTYVNVHEKTGMRKDRYSSLAYNFWVMKELENKLTSVNQNSKNTDFVMRKPKIIDNDGYYC